jgi:hypothetical protein
MESYDDDPMVGAVLEALPEAVVASLEERDGWRKQLADSTVGLEFIVSDLARWPVGSVVRVAFLDGDTALHADIVAALAQITDNMNLTLDFGLDPATGAYRRWSETDTAYSGEIRVSFDMAGYWSLVGTDSTDKTIAPGGPIGGGPGQRSLNLSGFTLSKPPNWEGIVRHEFLHAVAFQHEHQNMRGPCEGDFRWQDDPGYVPTTNASGSFVPDAQGRRPGIYTYLSGPPNQWSKSKVDHNLRTVDDPNAVAGPFDAASVMLYRFAAFFYSSNPSPCAPIGTGVNLSDGDKRGLTLLYPEAAEAINALAAQSMSGLELMGAGNEVAAAIESIPGPGSAHADRLIELMTAHARAGG